MASSYPGRISFHFPFLFQLKLISSYLGPFYLLRPSSIHSRIQAQARHQKSSKEVLLLSQRAQEELLPLDRS